MGNPILDAVDRLQLLAVTLLQIGDRLQFQLSHLGRCFARRLKDGALRLLKSLDVFLAESCDCIHVEPHFRVLSRQFLSESFQVPLESRENEKLIGYAVFLVIREDTDGTDGNLALFAVVLHLDAVQRAVPFGRRIARRRRHGRDDGVILKDGSRVVMLRTGGAERFGTLDTKAVRSLLFLFVTTYDAQTATLGQRYLSRSRFGDDLDEVKDLIDLEVRRERVEVLTWDVAGLPTGGTREAGHGYQSLAVRGVIAAFQTDEAERVLTRKDFRMLEDVSADRTGGQCVRLLFQLPIVLRFHASHLID